MATEKAKATKTKKKVAPKATNTAKTKVTTVKAVGVTPRRDRWTGLKSVRTPLLSASVAEFVGTFLLAVMVLATRNEPIYMLFGLVGVALAVAVISGAHLNPAITIGAWVSRKVSGVRALAYVVAQVIGAMLAVVVVSAYVNNAPAIGEQAAMLGQQTPQIFTAAAIPANAGWGIFFAELLGLIVLGFAYASAYRLRHRALSYGFTVGAGLFVALLVAGGLAAYLTGTAVLNPAVAISVQALSWELWPILGYVVAPVLGSILGFGLHKLLADTTEETTVVL